MTVDQFQPAVGQFVGQQAAGKPDLPIQRLQGPLLRLRMQPIVPLVRRQIAGADAAMSLDAVADPFVHCLYSLSQ